MPEWNLDESTPAQDVALLERQIGLHVEAVTETYSEYLVRERCKALGARDIFDLFRIKRGEGSAADSVREEMPDQLGKVFTDYFGDQHHSIEASQIAGTLTPGVFFDPSSTSLDLRDESLWESIKLYFGRFSLVDSFQREIYVPVFCARPADVRGSKFKVTYETATTTNVGFKLELPGLHGGFGNETTVTLRLESMDATVGFQMQSNISGIMNKWENESTVRHTFCPLERVKTRLVNEGDADYINYNKKSKYSMLDVPLEDKIAGQSMTYDVKYGAADEFEFGVNIGPTRFAYTVKSISTSSFSVRYGLIEGHTYYLYGIHRPCHDVFLRTAPWQED